MWETHHDNFWNTLFFYAITLKYVAELKKKTKKKNLLLEKT